jgi:hypothetical protein
MKYIQESECEQFHEAQNIDTDTKTILDTFKILHEKMSEMLADNPNLQINLEKKFSEMNISEINQDLQRTMSEMMADNQNFLKKLDKFHLNIENEIDYAVESKLGQNIEDITAVTDEISSKVTGVEIELNDKFEKLADDIDGEVNNMIPKVQVEDEDCTEENLKRQGEEAAQLNVNTKDIWSELSEEINRSQIIENTWVPDKSSSICISPTQANYGVTSESVIENTRDYKSICLFTKYAYNCITVIIDMTVYERDRAINNDKVKRNKKCKKLEWCINVKEKRC